VGLSASLVQACSLGRYRREFKSLQPHHSIDSILSESAETARVPLYPDSEKIKIGCLFNLVKRDVECAYAVGGKDEEESVTLLG
jgi:hypothetical protein